MYRKQIYNDQVRTITFNDDDASQAGTMGLYYLFGVVLDLDS